MMPAVRIAIRRNLPFLSAAGAFIAAVALLRPFRSIFYGGDDWAYGWSACQLAATGQPRISEWVAPIGLPQMVVGGLFARLFGCTPAALNASTLLFALLGVIGFYRFAREMTFSRLHSAVFAAAVSTTPVYLAFAGSFMTDMAYVSLSVWTATFCLRAFRRGTISAFVQAGLLCALSLLSRQVGLAFVLGFAVAIVVTARRDGRIGIRHLAAGLAIPLAVVAMLMIDPDFAGGRSITQRIHFGIFFRSILTSFNALLATTRLLRLSCFVLVLLLPLILITFLAILPNIRVMMRDPVRRRACLIAGLLWMLGALALMRTNQGLLVRGDVFDSTPASRSDQVGMLILSLIAIPLFVTIAASMQRADWPSSPIAVFLAATTLFHAGATVVFTSFFGYYALPLVPLIGLGLFAAARRQNIRPAVAVTVLVAEVVVSVAIVEPRLRYLEAAWDWAEREAKRRPVSEIYGEPGWFFGHQYDRLMTVMRSSDAEGVGDPGWDAAQQLRSDVRVSVRSDAGELPVELPSIAFEPAGTITYRTLLGSREAVVMNVRER